ncbi:acyltransferase [Acaricomes phytoseiuli]|uniref:acyltransferase family protein n=1 Tax=Acaricomes phytoseiuli TaxID=291968 RepID=UPI00036D39CD|nr:acyltransferase [Acaricomes phytoseiuli]MCW1249838.1 acyltransferase [Acaricomes phytoseiuli]
MKTRETLKHADDSPNWSANLANRDLVIDLIRTTCMFAVVVMHVLMVGISVRDGIAISNPLTALSWFAQGTWWGQIMPLFFIVGGFASLTSWRSHQRKGLTAATYLRSRLLRLARPALPLYAFLAIALWSAKLLGAPESLLSAVAAGSGVQLWFLAAYLICQSLVPLLARWHEAAPLATVAFLTACALAVDALRFITGLEAIGLLNMVFVWALAQQIGFFLADGGFDGLSRSALIGIAITCYLLMIPLTQIDIISGGLYPVDMLAAQNPPLAPLVLIGLAQICLVKAAYPALRRFTEFTATQRVMFLMGSRAMTVYLWHLPLIIALFGIFLALGLPFPEPGGASWWLSRPMIIVLVLVLTFAVTWPLAPLESATAALPAGAAPPNLGRVLLANALAAAGPFTAMRMGLDVNNVLWGTATLALALLLVQAWPVRSRAV